MIRVLIADDVMILRQGLEAVLGLDPDIEVVAVADNGLDAFNKCEIHKPDLVLMDMRMPDYGGGFGIEKIKEKYPEIKILVLTTFDDDETISEALRSGADGYILKEMDASKIISSVKNVNEGINVFGEVVFKSMKKHMNKTIVELNDTVDLTDREKDIIRCVVDGMDNKEIAAQMCLAEGTVRNNISSILEKLNLKDRTQLAVFAVKNNIA